MKNSFLAFVIAYFARFLGFVPGILISALAERLGKRFNGGLMGFTGGLLIAFICFEMLPDAMRIANVFVCVLGILLGIVIFAALENKTARLAALLHINSSNRYIRMGLFLSVGICLHNVMEGMSIGSLLNVSLTAALNMAVILMIHCIPEAVAVVVPFRKGGVSGSVLLLWALVLALPMAAGAVLGLALSAFSTYLSAVFLSFSGGTMIYIACGEILPESKSLWRGRFSSVAACFGFIVGIVLTSFL